MSWLWPLGVPASGFLCSSNVHYLELILSSTCPSLQLTDSPENPGSFTGDWYLLPGCGSKTVLAAGELYALGSQWPVLGNIYRYHFNQSELCSLCRMLGFFFKVCTQYFTFLVTILVFISKTFLYMDQLRLSGFTPGRVVLVSWHQVWGGYLGFWGVCILTL